MSRSVPAPPTSRPTAPRTPLIELTKLRVSYALETVLDIPHWAWRPGEHWAVIGGNGAGKTTLARLLADELRPSSGTYTSATGIRPGAIAHISFDLQSQLVQRDQRMDDSETRADAFDPGTTVAGAIAQGQSDGEAEASLKALLERFGLTAIATRGIRFVSTGESRKTLLARGLFSRPPMLILDNPLAGLDVAAQAELSVLLDELLRADGPPLLLLLDKPQDLPAAVTHLLWLENGRVRGQGPLVEVMEHYTAAARAADDVPTPPVALPPPRPRAPLPLSQPVIELRGLNLRYGDSPILTDIHWRLERGQHWVIMGPNGAGKSTLLSLISGDNAKGYGQPLWLFGRKRGSGESVWDIKSRLGLVGTAWQLQRQRRERVLEVVASGLFDSDGLFNDCSGSDRAAVRGWLSATGLDPVAETRFDRLSFGQQRLALIARAMVKTPPLLVLDEPCLGLDEAHRDMVLRLTERIAASGHTQILYVSHRAEEVPRCIDHRLSLVPHPQGGHTAMVESLTPANNSDHRLANRTIL